MAILKYSGSKIKNIGVKLKKVDKFKKTDGKCWVQIMV